MNKFTFIIDHMIDNINSYISYNFIPNKSV